MTYLDLSWNKITTLQNVSLVEKRNIRFVDGFPIDVSKEELRDVISIIDLIIPRAFCMKDIAYNKIESNLNNNNWAVDVHYNYDTGYSVEHITE